MAFCYKTFVSVGNSKFYFTRLLQTVQSLLNALPQPVLIQRGHTPFFSENCDIVDFVPMDQFVNYIENAKIIILHAGAGSTIQTLQAAKRPILMPRRVEYEEHVNNHQVEFANQLSALKKIILVNNEFELSNAIDLELKGNEIKSYLSTTAAKDKLHQIISSLMK